jgi:serine protease Do
MKKKKLFGSITLAAAGIVFSAVLVSGFGWVRPSYAGGLNLGAKKPPVVFDAEANAFSKAFTEVAEKVTPTIVNINVVADAPENKEEEFFFFPFQNKENNTPKQMEGSGSGIIISDDGYILTNNHVVEKASKVTVGLNDKRSFEAKVIGTDPLTDLAVIKIDAKNLPVAYLGESDNLKVGQWVMAIGNPYGLSSTVTAGIVSAIGRGQLGLINGQTTENGSYGVEDFIQTDAAINPGNSGGALVDLSGAVIGVNAAIATRTGSYVGYGFAIPISLAKSVALDLIEHGKVNRGYIGVQITEVDAALAKSMGLDKPKGVIVQSLVSGGSAEKADIKQGDIILKIDGKEVNKSNELQGYIATKSAGTVVKLLIFRDGKEIERSVTLKSRDTDAKTEKISDKEDKKEEKAKLTSFTFDKLGMTVKNMTSKEKEDFKVEKGVLISEVKQFSKAYDQRLGNGLVIIEADRKKVKNVDELKEIFEKKKGNAVLLRVQDAKGNASFIGLDIPE